jgi:putative transposase
LRWSRRAGQRTNAHLLLDLPPTVQLSQAVQHLKGNSSHWLNQERAPFAWQQGYGAFGIGESQRQAVVAYIANQVEHHKKWSFEQEFVTRLRKYGLSMTIDLSSGKAVSCLRYSGH